MRVLAKIFFCFLFLVFSLTNYISAYTSYSQNSVSAQPQMSYRDIYVSADKEEYFILPSTNSDNGISSGLHCGKVPAFSNNLLFVDTEQNIFNTYIIALLFKTEINANAPPSGVYC